MLQGARSKQWEAYDGVPDGIHFIVTIISIYNYSPFSASVIRFGLLVGLVFKLSKSEAKGFFGHAQLSNDG